MSSVEKEKKEKKRKSREGDEVSISGSGDGKVKKKSKKSSKSKDNEETALPNTEEATKSIPDSAPKETKSGIFSDQVFDELPIGDKTKGALKELGFEKMTQIQAKSIPDALAGKGVIASFRVVSFRYETKAL